MNINFITKALFFIGLIFLPCTVLSNPIEQQRMDFLSAEQAINQGNDAVFLQLSTGLVDYPLYPYLQYQWLNNHLLDTDKILAFLANYSDSRYAPMLRAKWLAYLAGQQRWREFIQNYQASDNTALECQFQWASYQTGNIPQALNEAKRLWVTGETLPKECDSLLIALLASPLMTSELMWQRFELALTKDNVALATHIQHLMNQDVQSVASSWLQIHNNPALVMQSNFWQPSMGALFAHGVLRLAKSELDMAIAAWDSNKTTFNPSNELSQQVEHDLALALARKRDARAFERLNLVLNPDEDVRDWKVRAALLEQNWQHVSSALAGLTSAEQQQPKWQYWQARALGQIGDIITSQTLFANVAQDRSFYGFLAADTVNRPYQANDKPVLLASNELDALANETDFKVVKELSFLHRDQEAKRQWSYAIKKLPKQRLLVAAKLAQAWQWDQIAIMTLVQADYWDDLALRFPVTYSSQVISNATVQQLEPALVFGLIRQESMLDKNAESPVGARGLMQIMPDTGRQIAGKMNEPWQSASSLFNPDTNIKYGTFYYKQMLNRFNGNFAMAAAAYNAGPHRVDKWLPNGQWMPADVWIETIPFKETRKYVTSVLSYTLIYSQRLQQNTLKIKNFLPDVPSG
ncbi:MAG: transglycosylase SLT domain-containing protein [Methylococcales bacterium]|nr:transglycosylase SLT domain-containing protein [Methylococcales bacterium]